MNRKIKMAVLSLSVVMATSAFPAATSSVAAARQPTLDVRAHLTVLYEGADLGSPARFRLIEELDRLPRL